MAKQAPITKVIISIPHAFQDEIVTESGLKFYLDASYQKNWNATVTATIEALPVNPHPSHKKIIEGLKVGDKVAVSYQIVSSLNFGSDGARFMETLEPSDVMKDYRNGKGERLSVYALPKRTGITDIPMWVGLHQDKYGEIISGTQGTEEEVGRWQSQYQFGKTDTYTFDNLFELDGKDYWQCSPDQIFAKKVKGHLAAVGNRIICKPIEQNVPAEMLQHIRHNKSVKVRFIDRARVISSSNKNFKKDEIVSFDPQKTEKYTFWDKEYYLIREDFVLGKWRSGSWGIDIQDLSKN